MMEKLAEDMVAPVDTDFIFHYFLQWLLSQRHIPTLYPE